MPGMNGLEVVKKLREQISTRLIPIIMITAADDLEREVGLIEAGADDYIAKPIETKRLFARMKRLLSKKELD